MNIKLLVRWCRVRYRTEGENKREWGKSVLSVLPYGLPPVWSWVRKKLPKNYYLLQNKVGIPKSLTSCDFSWWCLLLDLFRGCFVCWGVLEWGILVELSENTPDHGVRVVFTSMSLLRTHKFYVFMFCIICFKWCKQSLQWWFRCMWLKACVGPVCVGMCTAEFDNSTGRLPRVGGRWRSVSLHDLIRELQ